MLAGIRDVSVIMTPADATAFCRQSVPSSVSRSAAQLNLCLRQRLGSTRVRDNILYGSGWGTRLGRLTEIHGEGASGPLVQSRRTKRLGRAEPPCSCGSLRCRSQDQPKPDRLGEPEQCIGVFVQAAELL